MDELSEYVFRHYKHLMTPAEKEALVGLTLLGKGIPSSMESRSDRDEVKHMALLGWGNLRRKVVERLLAEHSAEIFLNRCPICSALCRTPKARQCLLCGHDWHGAGASQSQPKPEEPRPIAHDKSNKWQSDGSYFLPWLKRRVSPDSLAQYEPAPRKPSNRGTEVTQARIDEMRKALSAGGELWKFRSPPATWARKCGREGLAVVRDGEIVAVFITRMN